MSFSKELDEAYEVVVEGSVNETAHKTAAKALQAVVFATPVGNPDLWESAPPPGYTGGHARRNWMVEIDTATAQELDGEDAQGTDTVRDGVVVAGRFDIKRHTVINLHNSVPYINRLDNGWSEQQPAGFVDRAAQAASR